MSNTFQVNPEYTPAKYRPNVNVKDMNRYGVYGAIGGGLLGLILALRSKSMLAKILLPVGLAATGGAISYAGKGLYDGVQGTSYDYSKYKAPTKPGQKVVIGISGGGGGPGGQMDKVMNSSFGAGNVAMFNWRDRDALRDYINSLPEDTEIEAHGWSYGGSTLMNMIKELKNRRFKKVVTYDPVSWTDRIDDKLDNIGSWTNVLPGTQDAFNGANTIAVVGGRWGKRSGANNILTPKTRMYGGDEYFMNHADFEGMHDYAVK
jgi:hypothetical protein